MFSIREEIFENAFNEIDKINQEKDALKLVADCAVDALRKVIGLHFYFHKDPIDVNKPTWCPDKPISPSPPDTWSARRVIIKPKPAAEKSIQDKEVVKNLEVCRCNLGVDCLCMKTFEERIEKPMMELLKETRRKTGKSAVSLRPTPESSAEQSSPRNIEVLSEVIGIYIKHHNLFFISSISFRNFVGKEVKLGMKIFRRKLEPRST